MLHIESFSNIDIVGLFYSHEYLGFIDFSMLQKASCFFDCVMSVLLQFAFYFFKLVFALSEITHELILFCG